jgi:hypothetical protein
VPSAAKEEHVMKARGFVVSLLAGAITLSALTAGEPPSQGKPDDPQKASQSREEDLERVLGHCRKMLDVQTTVLNETKGLHKVIEETADKKPRPKDLQVALELSGKAQAMVKEATKAIDVLEAEGSAVAFLEVLRGLRDDVKRVQGRLENGDVGPGTQDIEQDVIVTLKEMIEALGKG